MTLVFCIHYFLWYGALTSIFGYESVYARHYTQASAAEYGILNMLLPFATVLVTPVVCSMADRLHSMLPLLLADKPRHPAPAPPGGQLLTGPWIYYCLICLLSNISMGINICLSDSFAVLQAEEQGTSFGRIIVWGTYGWALSALIQGFVNQVSFLPRLVPGLLLGTLLLSIDVIMVSLWRRNSDFKLDTIPSKAAQTLTSSSSSLHREPSDYQPQNESALINLGLELRGSKRQTKSPVKMMLENELVLKQQQPAERQANQNLSTKIAMSCSDVGFCAPTSSLAATLSESTCKNVQPATKDTKQELSKAVLGYDESGAKCASFRIQLVMLLSILRRRPSLLRFLVLFVLSGFFMSMHWNYFFLFLEELHGTQFETVSAFSMICQSIVGELPFFILSRPMIDLFGRSQTLSWSFISMGLRFLLYAFFLPNVNAYLVIFADCLQGPNYGLFYVVMTEVGLEYSYCDDETVEMLSRRGHLDGTNKRQVDSVRLLLKSTVQSVAFACYEGIGLGLGSIVGGFILVNYPFKVLWTSMALGAFLVGLVSMQIERTCQDHGLEEERSDRREFVEAKAKGLIERVVSPVNLRSGSNGTPGNVASAQSGPLPAAVARKSAGGPVGPRAAAVNHR